MPHSLLETLRRKEASALSDSDSLQGFIQALGPGLGIGGSDEDLNRIWEAGHVEVGVTSRPVADRQLRAIWRKRRSNRATPLVLFTPPRDGSTRVLGPERAEDPVREVTVASLLALLREIEGRPRREAAASVAAALERLDRAGIPGVIIRGLLTKHVLTRRLRRNHPRAWEALHEWAARMSPLRPWRENLAALGYQVEARPDRGYLLRSEGRPLAVLHPFADPAAFTRLTNEGTPPDGLLVADCRSERVDWGLLATDSRFRLFPASTSVGAATARYLEMDVGTTTEDGWRYLGLLAPDSLRPGGLLERLVREAEMAGNELREEVEKQIREQVLPALARALGSFERGQNHDLASPNARKLIEDAALLALFRLLFFLYLEGRNYLPLSSSAYAPHSASTLLQEARGQAPNFDQRAATLWGRFTILVEAMRTGNTAWGLPPYNGDLFASHVLEGAELLEEARLKDSDFGPALAALAFDPEGEAEEAGVDYGDLEIAHLGRIYEGLLSLRLSLATEPMVYDARIDRWLPAGRRKPEVPAGDLFFQTESGGRKAAGVYYTPQVIVRHLIDHSVRPALEQHLQRVEEIASRNVRKATEALFDFKVVDPAMGSAHFLADALDVIAERMSTFLAERPMKPIAELLDGLRAEAKWEGRIEDGDLLRRLVLKRCIYGVDLSGMAVEVAKVSLWLASFVPGLSLAYLGHNLRRGNSLVGVSDTGVLLDLGPLAAQHENAPIPRTLRRATEVALRIAETTDRNPEEVEASRRLEQELQDMTEGLTHAFDLWTAEAFGLKGARSWLVGAAEKVIDGKEAKGEAGYLRPAIEMAESRAFFHWPIEFPEVFSRAREASNDSPLTGRPQRPIPGIREEQMELADASGPGARGFDVVVGNPPWEELTVEELAFYAIQDPGLRGLTSEAERRGRIDALQKKFPGLKAEFELKQKGLAESRRFFGPQSGYVAQGSGDPDTYKLFCERYRALTRTGGRLGVVLPRSALLVDGSREFRRWLFRQAEVRRIDFILNNRSWAFPIHPQYTIALVAARRALPEPNSTVAQTGPSASRADFERASAGLGTPVRLQDLGAWTDMDGGPGYEVPLLPSREAVEVFGKLRAGPKFGQGYPGLWAAFPVRELDETNDRRFFRHKEGVPVWKGRCFDQFDPHGSDPVGYARRSETMKRLQAKRFSRQGAFYKRFPEKVLRDEKTHPFYSARVAFRDVSRATDSRTVRACLIPPDTFLTNKAPYFVFTVGGPTEAAFVLGVMNSLVFDWQARRLVETTLNFYLLNMLCFPPPETTDVDAIARRSARLSCADERFAEFAEAVGVDYGKQSEEEWEPLWAGLDALVARAYGLSDEDLEVIFSDFTERAEPTSYRDLVRMSFAALPSEEPSG